LGQSFITPRSRIGIQVQPMTSELREYFKSPADRGLLVALVEPGRPAARAGLQVGDVIVRAAGKPMQQPLDLVKVVARAPEAQALEVDVVREGKKTKMKVYPEGEAIPWVDPEYWSEWMQRGLGRGSQQLRQQLQEFERRLEELERRFKEQQLEHPSEEEQRT
jgi:C-terminal processing protease CtpA/Prc